MHFTYPKHVDIVLSTLPTTLEECTKRIVEVSVIYQQLYITSPDSAQLLLDSASHIKYREIILSEDHSYESEAFVLLYENQLPRMIWRSEQRTDYLFEANWDLSVNIKNGDVPKVFEDDTDIFQLQMLRLPCEEDFGQFYLDRLFKTPPYRLRRVRRRRPKRRLVSCRPSDVLYVVGDMRVKNGRKIKRTGVSMVEEVPYGRELPSFGPGRYHIRNANRGFEPSTPTYLISSDRYVILPRFTDVTSVYLSACGFTLYNGLNYTALLLKQTRKQWKRRKKKNHDVRTLQECAYQVYLHNWLMGF